MSLAFVSDDFSEPVLVGLRDDGTVVATGPLSNEAAQWTDIAAIAAAGSDIYGVRMDGSVAVARSRGYLNWCVDKVEEWDNIVEVFPCCYQGNNYAVIGLKNDGTVIAGVAGARDKDRQAYCKAQKWRLFNSLDTLEQERTEKRSVWQATKEQVKRKKAEKRVALEAEQASLQAELANLKGFFTGKRRKEIGARLAEIETELKKP